MAKAEKNQNKELAVYGRAYDETQRAKLRTALETKTYPQFCDFMDNEIKKSKEMSEFKYELKCFLDDGAYQLNRAVEEVYGVSITKMKDGPSADKVFKTLDIKLSDGSRIKVPFDDIALPDMGKDAMIKMQYDSDRRMLIVFGRCQTRFNGMMDQIIETTQKHLDNNSIYKNQAIEIDANMQPKFINLSNIEKDKLILSDVAKFDLIPLESRITKTSECIQNNIPLKYGTLLSGPYGTGKTLLAFKLAKKATNNNWMFIYLKDCRLTGEVLDMCKTLSKNGNGIVLFAEDIDIAMRGDRGKDNVMQNILNTLDGGDTKNMNVISIFTTNHIELIEPTFLRGKRIGSIIQLSYIDRVMAKEFIREYITDCNEYEFVEDPNVPLDSVCISIEENNIAPAFMAEIIEKIKTVAIHTGSNKLTSKDIDLAVKSYLNQVNLSRVKDTTNTPEKVLYNALKEVSALPKDQMQEIADLVYEKL